MLTAASAAAALASSGLHPYAAVEPHMGTLFRIKLYAANEGQAQRAFRAAFDRIAALDRTMSDYKADSELNRVCSNAVGRAVPVSADLFRVLDASQRLSRESGGAFDITVGPLTRLWRTARKQGRIPDPAVLREAESRCGFRKLHLDSAHWTVRLDQPGMQLDLGAIAKGYAADEALEVISKVGVRSALVAASGDLAFSDAPPGQKGWKIGIDPFDQAGAPFTRVLLLTNAAVSTSGASEQHLDANGVRYSHIIDPHTGLGLTDPITVTVVARHGIESDPMATTVSVLGAKRGLAFVERQNGVAALILDGQGSAARVIESSRFRLLPQAKGHTWNTQDERF